MGRAGAHGLVKSYNDFLPGPPIRTEKKYIGSKMIEINEKQSTFDYTLHILKLSRTILQKKHVSGQKYPLEVM